MDGSAQIGDNPDNVVTNRQPSVQIWGVLNVTPDSFSDGGLHLQADAAVAHAERMLADGADVIDVGGESSRPAGHAYGAGAERVSEQEEIARVVPVVRRICALGARVSIDTVKPGVARRALDAGARIVNDVSCASSLELLGAVAEAGAEYVVMHNRGRGEVGGDNVVYADLVSDVVRALGDAVHRALELGVSREAIWLDPGLGFAKTPRQSLALLAHLDELVALGHPVLVGPSRKLFVAAAAPDAGGAAPSANERLGGTAAAAALAVLAGVRAVRAHDVREVRQAVRFTEALLTERGAP